MHEKLLSFPHIILVHKDIEHMPTTALDSNSELVWINVFVNKISQYFASKYRNLMVLAKAYNYSETK